MPVQTPQGNEFLSCPICYNPFEVTVRRPISLGCGHTVCRHCLYKLQRKQCPFDQTPIHTDIGLLPENSALLQLVGGSTNCCYEHHLHHDQGPAEAGGGARSRTSIPPVPGVAKEDLKLYLDSKKFIEELALFLKPNSAPPNAPGGQSSLSNLSLCGGGGGGGNNGNGSVVGSSLSRPMQRKLVTLINCQLVEEEGRLRALRATRSLGERSVTELILQHQNAQQLSANLWAAVRARGCQFLGPAMQEEVLKLVLLALEDGSALSRKVLVMYVVQRLAPHFPQASKTSIGHVVQLLYRASCFKVSKREGDSSLMQLKEEFRTYEALRREHDAQIVQIATEAGLRIAPEQWSSLLYGDTSHKSHMQSIIDKLQTPQSFGQSVQELVIALQRTGDPGNLSVLRPHLELLALIDPSPDTAASSLASGSTATAAEFDDVHPRTLLAQGGNQQQPASVGTSWSDVGQSVEAAAFVVKGLVEFIGAFGNRKLHEDKQILNVKYKTNMCRDLAQRGSCPRGANCTFAHSQDEMDKAKTKRVLSRTSLSNNGNGGQSAVLGDCGLMTTLQSVVNLNGCHNNNNQEPNLCGLPKESLVGVNSNSSLTSSSAPSKRNSGGTTNAMAPSTGSTVTVSSSMKSSPLSTTASSSHGYFSSISHQPGPFPIDGGVSSTVGHHHSITNPPVPASVAAHSGDKTSFCQALSESVVLGGPPTSNMNVSHHHPPNYEHHLLHHQQQSQPNGVHHYHHHHYHHHHTLNPDSPPFQPETVSNMAVPPQPSSGASSTSSPVSASQGRGAVVSGKKTNPDVGPPLPKSATRTIATKVSLGSSLSCNPLLESSGVSSPSGTTSSSSSRHPQVTRKFSEGQIGPHRHHYASPPHSATKNSVGPSQPSPQHRQLVTAALSHQKLATASLRSLQQRRLKLLAQLERYHHNQYHHHQYHQQQQQLPPGQSHVSTSFSSLEMGGHHLGGHPGGPSTNTTITKSGQPNNRMSAAVSESESSTASGSEYGSSSEEFLGGVGGAGGSFYSPWSSASLFNSSGGSKPPSLVTVAADHHHQQHRSSVSSSSSLSSVDSTPPRPPPALRRATAVPLEGTEDQIEVKDQANRENHNLIAAASERDCSVEEWLGSTDDDDDQEDEAEEAEVLVEEDQVDVALTALTATIAIAEREEVDGDGEAADNDDRKSETAAAHSTNAGKGVKGGQGKRSAEKAAVCRKGGVSSSSLRRRFLLGPPFLPPSELDEFIPFDPPLVSKYGPISRSAARLAFLRGCSGPYLNQVNSVVSRMGGDMTSPTLALPRHPLSSATPAPTLYPPSHPPPAPLLAPHLPPGGSVIPSTTAPLNRNRQTVVQSGNASASLKEKLPDYCPEIKMEVDDLCHQMSTQCQLRSGVNQLFIQEELWAIEKTIQQKEFLLINTLRGCSGLECDYLEDTDSHPHPPAHLLVHPELLSPATVDNHHLRHFPSASSSTAAGPLPPNLAEMSLVAKEVRPIPTSVGPWPQHQLEQHEFFQMGVSLCKDFEDLEDDWLNDLDVFHHGQLDPLDHHLSHFDHFDQLVNQQEGSLIPEDDYKAALTT